MISKKKGEQISTSALQFSLLSILFSSPLLLLLLSPLHSFSLLSLSPLLPLTLSLSSRLPSCALFTPFSPVEICRLQVFLFEHKRVKTMLANVQLQKGKMKKMKTEKKASHKKAKHEKNAKKVKKINAQPHQEKNIRSKRKIEWQKEPHAITIP